MAATTKLDAETEATMRQFREFLMSYNKVSEMCFTDCIHDFTSRKVAEGESSCALNCLEKYMKITQRIGQKFHDYQTQQSEGLLTNRQTGATGGLLGR